MQTALLILDVIVAIALVALILIQQGKGADVGAAFGSGASQTVFGSQGTSSFLTHATAVLATLFFCISLALAYFSSQPTVQTSVTDSIAPATLLPKTPLVDIPQTPANDLPSAPARSRAPADVPQ